MRQKYKLIVYTALAFFLIILVFPSISVAGTAKLTWQAGSPETVAPTGYKIYYSTTSVGSYTKVIDVGNVLTYTVTGLADDTPHYFAVTAYSSTGAESGYSNEEVKIGSRFYVDTATFTWEDSGADAYGLWVGTSSGSYDIFGTYATSGQIVTGLPTDGSTIYVKLWSFIGGVWYESSEYIYATAAAEIETPASGSTLSGGSAAFTWNDVEADAYGLWVGTSSGSYDIYGTTAISGETVTGLPTDGSTVYVKVWSFINGVWYESSEYTYTTSVIVGAEIQSPTDGSTLSGGSAAFTWNDVGADAYGLWVGTSSGSYDIYGTTATSGQTVTGLPTDGSTVYVKVWSFIGGAWYESSEYTYTTTATAIQSPTDGSTLSGGSATFTWNDSGADAYGLWVGTSSGTYDIYGTYATSGQAVTGLPTDGSTVYVKLWSFIGGAWYVSSEYTYTAGP